MKSCVIPKQSTETGPDARSVHAQTALEKQDLPCTSLAHYELESMNDITITVIVLTLHIVQSIRLRLSAWL